MNFYEQYQSAVDLCYVQSLNDPENEPYKSKYAARNSFEQLRQVEINEVPERISKELETLDLNDQGQFVRKKDRSDDILTKYRFLIRLLLDYHIGTIYSDTEEKSEGESRLREILTSIEQAIPHSLLNALALHVFNQLILIRTSYEQYNEAIELAQRAEQLYQQASSMDSFGLDELIQIESSTNRREDFEQIYTHTLFYLAQIYGKLQQKDQSAMYCRLTLERQLVLFHEKSSKFDALDWATSCATLSQYYMGQHDFATARHCLMCADQMLENVDSMNEKLSERTASFKRCWIKYAINLLSDSADRLLQAADRDVNPNAIIRSSSTSQFHFDLPLPSSPVITCSFILDFDQARPVFLFAMQKIKEAKSYYILDGFVTDHVELCQDNSQLYSKLIFFESHRDRKCKMYKRRIDLLVELCEQISEEYYLYLMRQLLFELGECYVQLLDLKLEEKDQTKPSKISKLTSNGIGTFQRFLNTMNEKKSNQPPETYADEYLRPVLLAHFYIARLHSKYPDDRLEHFEESLKEYRLIVDYVDRHVEARAHIEQEYHICKEMIELLPLKIEQLRLKK